MTGTSPATMRELGCGLGLPWAGAKTRKESSGWMVMLEKRPPLALALGTQVDFEA